MVCCRPVILNGRTHRAQFVSLAALSPLHNLFSFSRSLTIEVSAKKPLLSLVGDVAAVALWPDVVLVPAGGHVPPARKMSCLSLPDQIPSLAGVALDSPVGVGILRSYVSAEPVVEFIAQLG